MCVKRRGSPAYLLNMSACLWHFGSVLTITAPEHLSTVFTSHFHVAQVVKGTLSAQRQRHRVKRGREVRGGPQSSRWFNVLDLAWDCSSWELLRRRACAVTLWKLLSGCRSKDLHSGRIFSTRQNLQSIPHFYLPLHTAARKTPAVNLKGSRRLWVCFKLPRMALFS